MRLKYRLLITGLIFSFGMFSIHYSINKVGKYAFARTIRKNYRLKVDGFGTKTFYKEISGEQRVVKVVDRFANDIEKYFYEDSILKRASIRNLYSGKWIDIEINKSEVSREDKKEKIYNYSLKVFTGGNAVSEDIFYRYFAKDKTLEFVVTVLNSDSPRGVGLSIKNWFMKYINNRSGVNTISSLDTHSPAIIVMSKKLMVPESIEYKIMTKRSLILKEEGFLTDKELLMAAGSFRINEVDSKDDIKCIEGSYINLNGENVVIDEEGNLHTFWEILDEINIENIEIDKHWKVEVDGKIIGQIKNIGDPAIRIDIQGEPKFPIGIYIDRGDNIIQYQGDNVIKIINSERNEFNSLKDIKKILG